MRKFIVIVFIIAIIGVSIAYAEKDQTKFGSSDVLPAEIGATQAQVPINPAVIMSSFNLTGEIMPEYWHLYMQDPSIDSIILKEAKAQGFDKNPQVQKKIDDITSKIIIIEMIKQKLSTVPEATDEQLKEYYEKHKPDYFIPDNIDGLHMVVEKEGQANEILRQLADGEDFSRIASEKSIDSATKTSGGAMVNFMKDDVEYPLSFRDNLFKLRENEFKLIKAEDGFHIVKVTKRNTGKYEDFAAIKVMLRAQVNTGMRFDAPKEWVDSVKSKENK